MFTGIIEQIATVKYLEQSRGNLHISLSTPLAEALKVDQSVAHNGACLTVVKTSKTEYTVTAIKETLDKTNIKYWKKGHLINLERAMLSSSRFDGHIVQGHVDQIGQCTKIIEETGSKVCTFKHKEGAYRTVEKGSITVNGVSLTVVNAKPDSFSVAIIPYTLEYTNFKTLKEGDFVNLEFDIIGKYVSAMIKTYL